MRVCPQGSKSHDVRRRIYESGKPPAGEVLRLLAGAGGGLQALVAMMGLQFCSGSEAAARLLGALSQNISGQAARIAHHGAPPAPRAAPHRTISAQVGKAAVLKLPQKVPAQTVSLPQAYILRPK